MPMPANMRSVVALLGAAAIIFGAASELRAQRALTEDQAKTPAPGPGLWREPKPIAKAIELFDKRTEGRTAGSPPRNGFFLDMGDMITGSGFLAAGPGYRHHFFNDRATFETSAVLSTRLYTTAQASIEVPRVGRDNLTVGAQTFYQDATRVNYFGLGNDAPTSQRTGYGLRTNDVMGYAVLGGPRLALSARAGWLKPVDIAPTRGFQPSYPDTVEIFNDVTAPALERSTSFVHADLSLSADTRDHIRHPTDGGFYQATWSIYSDRGEGRHSFQRFDAEAVRFVPVASANWVLALRAWTALSRVADGHEVPFYLMPNLGGRNSRGYRDYRFHDRNMHAYSVESRWAVFDHLDAALFVDVGSVAPKPSDLFAQDFKRSYGVGVRIHNNKNTIGRVDLARSDEGWRIIFKMNDPFRRSSQSAGRPAVVPFVP